MLVAGLTGGIGSGKSTFASLLGKRGVEIIDADELGRMALRPGEPAWHSVVEHFGDEILVAGGMEVDRKRLASIVFTDRSKLATLNAIVHPVIAHGIADTLEALSGTDEIVVLDAALVIELGLEKSLDALIVVIADEEKRAKRLQRDRRMSLDDIRARMSSQASDETLIERADIVVRNNGTREDLELEADRVMRELEKLRSG